MRPPQLAASFILRWQLKVHGDSARRGTTELLRCFYISGLVGGGDNRRGVGNMGDGLFGTSVQWQGIGAGR